MFRCEAEYADGTRNHVINRRLRQRLTQSSEDRTKYFPMVSVTGIRVQACAESDLPDLITWTFMPSHKRCRFHVWDVEFIKPASA